MVEVEEEHGRWGGELKVGWTLNWTGTRVWDGIGKALDSRGKLAVGLLRLDELET